ncbi:hypothetical protein [Streptomyces sp. NPDC057557]|uniref:hypothetical protein n=1 Tax=Streptomyces sp. NPDC057557 TaxID=3346167 RepID=UPI0036786012
MTTPADRRPYRPMSATGPELVVTTDTHRLDLRQVGWLGQTGAFYALDEKPLGDGHERGGVAPLYFPAHSDRLDDLAPDDDSTVARQILGTPAVPTVADTQIEAPTIDGILRTIHTRHTDHCEHDGMPWPCPTLTVLDKPRHVEPAPAADFVTVNCFDVQLDNGENLKALAIGDHLDLSEPAAGMQPGTWQVVAYHGEFQDRATMRPAAATEEPSR